MDRAVASLIVNRDKVIFYDPETQTALLQAYHPKDTSHLEVTDDAILQKLKAVEGKVFELLDLQYSIRKEVEYNAYGWVVRTKLFHGEFQACKIILEYVENTVEIVIGNVPEPIQTLAA